MRQRIPWLLHVLTAVQIGGLCAAAHADPIVLDQAFVPRHPNELVSLIGDIDGAQTFTVGRTGLLSRIDLLLVATFPASVRNIVPFELRPTIGGVPVDDDTQAFARTFVTLQTHDVRDPRAIVSVPLDAFDVNVRRGDVLAIVLRAPREGFEADWWGSVPGSYRRGEQFARSPSHGTPEFTLAPDGVRDLGFRTFVDPAPVPEPTTALLVLSGMGALIARVRKRAGYGGQPSRGQRAKVGGGGGS